MLKCLRCEIFLEDYSKTTHFFPQKGKEVCCQRLSLMPNCGIWVVIGGVLSLRGWTSRESGKNQLPSRKRNCASVAKSFSSLETLQRWELGRGSARHPGNLLTFMLSTVERRDRTPHRSGLEWAVCMTLYMPWFLVSFPPNKRINMPQRVAVTLNREFHKSHMLNKQQLLRLWSCMFLTFDLEQDKQPSVPET